jgi:hypothetical protein
MDKIYKLFDIFHLKSNDKILFAIFRDKMQKKLFS